jgi:hypothetical protein
MSSIIIIIVIIIVLCLQLALKLLIQRRVIKYYIDQLNNYYNFPGSKLYS